MQHFLTPWNIASYAQVMSKNIFKLSSWGRAVLQVFLLVVFFAYFGWPAVERYLERKVMVVKDQRNTGGIPAPSITLEVRNPYSGWRHREIWGVEKNCNNTEEYNSIEQCIESNTFNQSEIVNDVLLGMIDKKSLQEEDEDLWIEGFTSSREGRYYTMHTSQKMEPNDHKFQLFLLLNYNFKYRISIHDKNFFILTYNVKLPIITFGLNPNESSSHYYNFELTEVEEVDLAEDPCNPDPDYNFQACVRETLST